ncbi:MAG: gliding motility-associated C-terminal domain-containing protein [Crocinitomicaceae bacterium]|nr:gliding motility-associated C-terminal domain-containing protein [Crocinitomicaceae bacterium]
MRISIILFAIIICNTFISYSQNNEPLKYNSGFIANKGQIANEKFEPISSINYKFEQPGINAYFKPDGIIYHFYREEEKSSANYTQKEQEAYNRGDFSEIGKLVYFFRMDFKLINSNPAAEAITENQIEVYTNYYLPHCPDGITHVPSFESITYKDVYPNIDLVYKTIDGQLKYEFIVHPGGNINDINFTYDGAKDIQTENGALNVVNDFGPFQENEPYCFYAGENEPLDASFKISEQSIGFDIKDTDPSKTLVIDPTVTWATYYSNGGSSDFHANSAFDSDENLYLAYATYSATWTTINAGGGQYYDATRDGSTDLILMRFNSDYSLQWITYYGGDKSDFLCGTGGDYGKTIDVDDNNGIYLGGYANSNPTTFPTQNSGVGGAFYQDASFLKGGDNAFVIKFNQNGVRQWGTLFQHTNVSTSGASVRINGIKCNGTKLYFTGELYTSSGYNIPLVSLAGAYNNTTKVGSQDMFVGRFNSDCVLEWSSYLNSGNVGATGYQQGVDLTFDASGNMILVGQVGTNALGVYTLNPGGGAYFSNTISGFIDNVVTRFNSNMQPTWSTIIGGTDLDRVSEVSTDPSGNILVACRMARAGYPTVNPGGGAFYQSALQSTTDGFIMKFTPGGVYTWGTYVGNTTAETSITGIASDNSGNVYAIGYTSGTNFPQVSLSGAYNQGSNAGGNDLLLLRFTPASVCDWSTYFGGSLSETCYGTKIEPSTIANSCGYQQFFSFSTQSTNLPTTNPGGGAHFEGSLSGTYSKAILLFEESSGSTASAPTSISGTTTICSGSSTTLTQVGGVLGTGGSYEWYSGSCGGTFVGSGTSVSVSPTSNTTYYVRVEGPCGITTCASVSVTVQSNSTAATGINATANPICVGASTTLSVQGGSLGTGANWQWYTGSCGGTSAGSGTSISVSPTSGTTYYVRAVGTCNTTSCQSVAITVNTLSTDPTSASATSATICDGQSTTISVNGGSLGTGASWEWYTTSCGGSPIGSGTSLSVSPSSTTTYFVRAEGTCNTTNCASVMVTVNPVPTPSITSSNSALCEGDNLTLTATPTGGTWSVTSGPGSIATDVLTATGSGTINLEYSVTQSGCTGTDNQSINVNALSDGSWTSPGTVCESGGSINLNTLITGDAGGTWSGTGVSGSTFDPTSLNGQTITITYDVGSACPASVQHDIIVESAVSAAWTQPTAICESDSPLDLSTLITGSAGGSWSGSGVSGTNFDPSGLSGMIAITYTVGSGSCSDLLTQDIEVLSAPVAPTFTANDSTICSGETVTLSGSGSGTVDYNIYDAASGGNLLGTAPLNVSPSTTTTYYLEAVGTNGCGNIGGTQPLMINVNPNPALSVSPDLQICPGQTATLTASGNGNFSWSTGETTSSISVTPTETSFYIVTLTDANGCTSSYQSTISVMTGSYVEALNDNATTNIDELVNIDVATNDNGDPLSVVIITNAINGVGSVQSDGTINYLPFSGYLGSDSLQYVICDIYCSYTCDSAWVKIEIDKADEFSIPGGFSPNGDGINEFFVISGLDSYPNNTLTIYNRWGDIVFSASPYMNNWSGQAEGKRTISGDVVVTGTYFYVLDLGDGSEMLNGSIEIKK